jgi:hypothetical protein
MEIISTLLEHPDYDKDEYIHQKRLLPMKESGQSAMDAKPLAQS